jgi:hypothetical protein
MSHAIRTTGLLSSRDLFVHDGTKLRRIRLSVPAQIIFSVAAALMLAWSAFAAAHFLGGGDKAAVVVSDQGQMQQLAAATEQRARLIEQRQKLLATMLAGGEVDPAALPETSDAGSLPAAIAAPLDRAEDKLAAEEAAASERLEQRYRTATR